MVKAGGEPRAGPRFRVRGVRSGNAQGRARADLGAPASDRPLRARHARRSLSVPVPGSASARSDLAARAAPEGLGERGAVTSGRGCRTRSVSAAPRCPRGGRPRCRTGPFGHRRGVGGSPESRGAGEGYGRRPVSAPPPSGAAAGEPAPGGGGGVGKVGVSGPARGSPRVPKGPGRDRGPGSRAVPCAPSEWRPPLRVEATGDRRRPALGLCCPPSAQPSRGPGRGPPLTRPAAFVSPQRRCSPASLRWRGASPKSSAATPRATISFTPMESASS